MLQLLSQWGYAAVVLAVLADSFGLPVPGEAMVLLGAVYAGTTHHLALPLVIAAAAVGAVAGDNISYTIGRQGGYPVLVRHGRLLHIGERRLKIGQYLFRRYGGVLVLVGRLIPVLHIWTAVLAGVNRMPRLNFVAANTAGAVVWASGLRLAGFVVGRAVLRSESFFGIAAIPVAVAIGLAAVLVLRVNEQRLYEAAEREARAERAAGH